MSAYMQHLKITTGYESLKTKYMRQLASKYPNWQGQPQIDSINSMDSETSECNEEENINDHTKIITCKSNVV